MITCLKSMQISLNITASNKTEQKTDRICRKPRFARNRRILQETEQDLPGALQSPLHIPSSLVHSRRTAVRHLNCLHNARSITKRLGTRQGSDNNQIFFTWPYYYYTGLFWNSGVCVSMYHSRADQFC